MANELLDMMGNSIHKDSLLFWKSLGAVVRVVDIEDPPNGSKDPSKLIIEIGLPFKRAQPDTHLGDFVAVVNPEDTKAVGAMADKLSKAGVK